MTSYPKKGLIKKAMTSFKQFEPKEFLKETWQQKVAYFPQELDSLPELSADELAGFALEEEVESRLMVELAEPSGDPLKSQWQVHHGPLDEDLFQQLDSNQWTLLVQGVDQLKPQFQKLKKRFSFIPNWRMDDIMVSYASDGGSAGPHFDYYDVFLIQLRGRRQWRIGQACDSSTALRDDTPCKLLQDFQQHAVYTCDPGDILYIPPGVAHWGIADGECMTISVGFRAPSDADIVLDLSQELASQRLPEQRYQDHLATGTRANPGLIEAQDIAYVQNLLRQLAEDEQWLMRWFGAYMTQPKRSLISYEFDHPSRCSISPSARLAYTETPGRATAALLFANGEALPSTLRLAQLLCNNDERQLSELIHSGSMNEEETHTIKQLKSSEILSLDGE